jgi:hypothetical protein
VIGSVAAEKKLQLISQNDTHISIIMPCFNAVVDEDGKHLDWPVSQQARNYLRKLKRCRDSVSCIYYYR